VPVPPKAAAPQNHPGRKTRASRRSPKNPPMQQPVRVKPFNWDTAEIEALVREALREDVGAGDRTVAATVPANASARARILAKQELVVAGLPLAQRVFRTLDGGIEFEAKIAEGERAAAGAQLARIEGRAAAILTGERTALNFLSHLSGVATLTRRFVEAIAGTRARIHDTRKTTPLLRALEKYAVRMGGGANHRFGLFDAILIKENHIALAGGVMEAIRRARYYAAAYEPNTREMTAYESFAPPPVGGELPIQVEVRSEIELRTAVLAGAESVLLDNVTPEEAGRLTAIVRRERAGCAVEVSGGVTLANVRAYAEAGVDFIAVGALTHSAPAADVSLLVEEGRGE